jgi:hemerythrin superfamily protein
MQMLHARRRFFPTRSARELERLWADPRCASWNADCSRSHGSFTTEPRTFMATTRKGTAGRGAKKGAKRATARTDGDEGSGRRGRKGAAAKGAKRATAGRKGAGGRKSAAGRGATSGGRGAARKGPSARKTGRRSAGAKKSSARKTSSRGGTTGRQRAPRMNALTMLREDHARVQEMFDRFEGMRDGPQKENLVRRILEELRLHTAVEEEIFYPAVRDAIDDPDLMDEAQVEHASAKQLMGEIAGMSMGDDLYDAKVTVLGEYVKHHVKEEQNEMFPRVREAGLDLRALGEAIAVRKSQGMEEGGREQGMLETAVRAILPGSRS